MADFFSSRGGGYYGESPEERSKRKEITKLRKILRSSREPMIPYICNLLLIGMIALPVLDLIMEIAMQIQAGQKLAPAAFALRVSWSLLMIWGFFAVPLLILSVIQLIRVSKSGYEERVYRFEDELKEGESLQDFDRIEVPKEERDQKTLTLYSKVIPGSTRARYLKYALVSGGGLAVLAILYFICRAVQGGA